jgi:hypothetical protein
MSNSKQQQKKEIKITCPPQVQSGVYANNTFIMHNKEEFIMNFLMIVPPTGTVASRVIVSPGHMKRMVKALQDNIAKYEARFGVIHPAEEPKSKIGFH